MASNDDVRMANIKLRQLSAADTSQDKSIQNALLAKIAEMASVMSANSETATDLTLTPSASATFTQLQTGGSGASGTSTKKIRLPKDALDEMAFVKISVTGGAGGTATFTIQGSADAAFTSPVTLSSADSAAPATFTAAGIVISCPNTTVTKVRILAPHQAYPYVRVIWASGTTDSAIAIDIWYCGGAGTLS